MADAVPGRVGVIFCQPCLRNNARNVADIYCEDCGEYQCEECEKMHKRFPVMSKHKMVEANKVDLMSSKYDMKGMDQCEEHHKLLEYFCEDENVPCCGKCAIVSHRSCRHVVEIEKADALKKLHFSDIQQKLVILKDKAKSVILHMESARNKYTKDASNIKDEIQLMQDKVNAVFEHMKQSVAKDITVFQKQAFDDFDAKTTVCNSCIADVEHIVAEIQRVSLQGTPAQQLIMATHIQCKVNELKRKTDIVYGDLRDLNLGFDFYGLLKLPPAKYTMPGNLTIRYEKNPKMSTVFVASQNKDQNINLKLLNFIDLNTDDSDVREPLYSGLDFLPDGRIVAVDNKNGKCLVFNPSLEMVHSRKLPFRPHGVVVLSEEDVALTTGDRYRIIFLKISSRNEINIVHECKVTKKFQSISLLDEDTLLVGSYDDPQPFRTVSMTGNERLFDINFPSKTFPFDTLDITCCKSRNITVISDRLADTVYIYDNGTDKIVEVNDELILKEPRRAVVGPDDCIFVCSYRTKSIVQISRKGRILSSHAVDMSFPRSISISKDNTRLVVSNTDHKLRQLKLFSIEIV